MSKTRSIARRRARDLRLISQILLVVQLVSFGHLLSSHHVTCLEHGDIIHIESSEAASPQKDDVDEDAQLRDSISAGTSAVGADHDHCQVCANSSRRGLLSGPAPGPVAQASLVNQVHAIATTCFAPIDLILLSPKNSPPSA